MAHVVVIGAGLGGLPTAYELRQLLPSQHRVTLTSDQPKFTFLPGLVRVGLDVDPTKMRLGAAVPWYERLGLRMMFGVDLVKPIGVLPPETPASASI